MNKGNLSVRANKQMSVDPYSVAMAAIVEALEKAWLHRGSMNETEYQILGTIVDAVRLGDYGAGPDRGTWGDRPDPQYRTWYTNVSRDAEEGGEASVLLCKECYDTHLKRAGDEFLRLCGPFRLMEDHELRNEAGCLQCDCGRVDIPRTPEEKSFTWTPDKVD